METGTLSTRPGQSKQRRNQESIYIISDKGRLFQKMEAQQLKPRDSVVVSGSRQYICLYAVYSYSGTTGPCGRGHLGLGPFWLL